MQLLAGGSRGERARGQAHVVVGVLEATRRAAVFLVAELQAHVREHTAPYKYPRIVEFADELPKTASGKIQRARLRGEWSTNGQ